MQRTNVVLSLFALMMCAAALQGEDYMDDGSSTYSDGYADDDYVYGTGNTLGELEIHSYGIDVTIESPLGRTASQQGSFGFGDVSTSVALTWNVNDWGVYGIRSEHELYCWYVHDTFWLATTTAVSTPPAPPCEKRTMTCDEVNWLAQIGMMKSHSCRYASYCCGPDYAEPISGIGSSDGDCAPSPSHTTGRAVFRIRRLNSAARDCRKIRWHQKPIPPQHLAFESRRCTAEVLAMNQAPRPVCAVFSSRGCTPSRRRRALPPCRVVPPQPEAFPDVPCESIPPAGRWAGDPRPVGSTPTSLGRTASRRPAVGCWFGSGSFATSPAPLL